MLVNRRMAFIGGIRRGLRGAVPAPVAGSSAESIASHFGTDFYAGWDTGISTLTGSPLETISDVGGNSDYDATQPTAGYRPTVSGTDVTFDGTDDSLRVREPPGLDIARGTFVTHVVYCNVDSVPGGTTMVYQSSAPSDAGSPTQLRRNGGYMEFLAAMANGGGTSSRTITTTDAGATGYRLYIHYIGDVEHYGRISGTQYDDTGLGSQSGIGNTGLDNLGLMNSALYDIYNWPSNGQFEHYILTGARTSDDWTWLEAFYTDKYGGI